MTLYIYEGADGPVEIDARTAELLQTPAGVFAMTGEARLTHRLASCEDGGGLVASVVRHPAQVPISLPDP